MAAALAGDVEPRRLRQPRLLPLPESPQHEGVESGNGDGAADSLRTPSHIEATPPPGRLAKWVPVRSPTTPHNVLHVQSAAKSLCSLSLLSQQNLQYGLKTL